MLTPNGRATLTTYFQTQSLTVTSSLNVYPHFPFTCAVTYRLTYSIFTVYKSYKTLPYIVQKPSKKKRTSKQISVKHYLFFSDLLMCSQQNFSETFSLTSVTKVHVYAFRTSSETHCLRWQLKYLFSVIINCTPPLLHLQVSQEIWCGRLFLGNVT